MSVYITVECPVNNCGAEIELECDYELRDPEVGIQGGVCIPDTPTKCEDCGTTYNEAQLIELTAQIERKVNSWEPDERDYDADYDDPPSRWRGGEQGDMPYNYNPYGG